jgi:hypothetical protein
MEHYDERLHEMLRVKRPHGSKAEKQWVKDFILTQYPHAYTIGADNDPAAYGIEVLNLDGSSSRTMFSCHVDTVHREGGKQTIKFDKKHLQYYKADGKPLGADDTAGCWVMLEMIDAGVPGVYVFHRGEECGGVGSSYIAQNHIDFLSRFDRAIAFDRRGAISVITHQGWGRCASDTFAQALADMLNEDGISMYAPDDTGVFTDTANYVDYIPECTNLSCGYANEHSGKEILHMPTLIALRNQCVQMDWESLPTERNPKVSEYKDDYKYYYASTTSKSNADYYNGQLLYNMSKAEMTDMAYIDPETFVALVREELFGEQDDEKDDYYTDVRGWANGI